MKKSKYSKAITSFLPRKYFIEGMGSILNIFGNYSYDFTSPAEQDIERSIASYWNTVGGYLYESLDQVKIECEKKYN